MKSAPTPGDRRAPRALLGLLALAAGLSAQAPVRAQSRDIYKCLDDDGRAVFQDHGRGKACERVDIFPVESVPVPRGRAPAAAASAATVTRATVSPANFPRVDGDTQRQRDVDRRRILEDEMRLEEERLARLRGDFNGGSPAPLADETRGSTRYQERTHRLLDDIERSEANLASLRRELALQRY